MEIFGFKIFKKKQIDSYFFNRYKTLKYILKKKEPLIIFDIGGNMGQSIKEFKIHFPESLIYSFEPDQNMFIQLRKYENMKIKCFNLALGDIENEKELNVYKESGNNSFLDINENNHIFKNSEHPKITNGVKKIRTQKCMMTTLDSFCSKNNIENIDILKIDVQGFENNVLRGALKMLENSRVGIIIVEIIFDNIYSQENSFFALESIFKDFGYSLWDISHIYKDINIGRTIWIDAIYISNKVKEEALNEYFL